MVIFKNWREASRIVLICLHVHVIAPTQMEPTLPQVPKSRDIDRPADRHLEKAQVRYVLTIMTNVDDHY